MLNASAAALSSAPARRDRSVQVRRKARNAKADREQQIVGLLNRGLSVAEIASRSGVSIKHMRNLVRKILAERMPQPPAEYLGVQVSPLNEALLVSYSAITIRRRGRTSKRSIESSGSCASSTAITDSPPFPARAGRVSRSAF